VSINYYVLRTRPVHRLEFDVMHAINQREYPAMVPFEEKLELKTSGRRKLRKWVKYPLFPCYVIVGLPNPEAFRPLKTAINQAAEDRGKLPPIINLIGYNAERPAVLNPLQVHLLKTLSVGTPTEINLHKAIQAGSRIDILDGGFAGRSAVVDRITKRSVFALLEVFNSMQVVEISRANVAAA
jgi:transcription antitermination factor NusG